MNKLVFLSAMLAFSLAVTHAQDVSGVKSNLDAQKGAKGGEKMAAPPAPKAPLKIAGGEVSYGGFLVDLAKGNKTDKLIDPRKPDKVKAETDNVYTDPQTGKPRGFVLFAIRF